jgi:hypothetical protein
MPWDRFVLGYHGCDQSIVADILTGRTDLHASRNDYDWLGHGIYFWEDSCQRAFQWARQSRRIKHPAVLGAVINLGHCLNLLDVEHLETVKAAHKTLVQTAAQAEIPLPANQGKTFKDRKLDCAVFETLHQMRKEENLEAYQTVRGFFVEGEALYEGAGLRHQDHIQLCVRDSASIVGFFLPRVK